MGLLQPQLIDILGQPQAKRDSLFLWLNIFWLIGPNRHPEGLPEHSGSAELGFRLCPPPSHVSYKIMSMKGL
jgi:hypothetical protein